MKHLRILAYAASALTFLSTPTALAQSVGTYQDATTSTTQRAQGVTIVQGSNAATVTTASDSLATTTPSITTLAEAMVFTGTVFVRQRGDANGTVVIPGLTTTWWRYAPPVGGLTNSTTGITVKTAAGAGVSNYIWGGECYADPLGTATEIELRDGAAGAAMWRMKVPTTGWTTGFDINFNPPLRGTANTLVEFAENTANGTGAIYCNWRGTTGS